jgi:hypothetical protein
MFVELGKEQSLRITALNVEVKELRAQIDALRGQHESHTHEYDTTTGDDWYTASTGKAL